MTLKCDLDHDLPSRVKGSAHRLNKRNIWVKFNKSRWKESGDIERTRKCYGRIPISGEVLKI